MTSRSYFEYINTVDNLEIWGAKYTFKTWYTPVDLINISTGEIYKAGDLCFIVISYMDSTGKICYTNEEKNLQEL
jgi:hypothetical protein